jgi:GNAT superfamily N-acetyltransferase
VQPEMCFIAEEAGEPVAFSITLPDSNIAQKAAGGHLTRFGVPLGLLRMLWATRKIDRVRVLLLGVRPTCRKKGLDAALFVETIKAARRLGYVGGEIGWILEDNEVLNRTIESAGGRRSKVYRLYGRRLEASAKSER